MAMSSRRVCKASTRTGTSLQAQMVQSVKLRDADEGRVTNVDHLAAGY
jgi:hypothetical protein